MRYVCNIYHLNPNNSFDYSREINISDQKHIFDKYTGSFHSHTLKSLSNSTMVNEDVLISYASHFNAAEYEKRVRDPTYEGCIMMSV